uniref:Cupin-like domain-containing protein n=1 Tax=viral metagenome TaxID=1070528 RepID=A0A6C0D0W8_9ZZZZ
MNFLKNLIIFFGTILLYLHIYIHFKISSINEFSQINNQDDLSKQKIMTTIYYKLPFVFDGTNIIKPFDLKEIKDKDKNAKSNEKIYKKTYEKMALLEPSVRFFTKDSVYELKKNKITLHRNLECRNFYLVHTGKVIIYCIHPKYKNKIDEINKINDINSESKSESKSEKMKMKEIEKFVENDDILRVELYPNSILFVPNYWYVCIKGLEKSVVEKVQYKTILNEVNFLYDRIHQKYSL